MSDIQDFEQRINAALERIRQAAETLGAGVPSGAQIDPDELATLREALDTERSANAQLEDRVRAIRERQENQVTQLELRVSKLTARADSADQELARLRIVNARLRENNAALRAANAEGLGDAGLINDGVAAELEAMRALRDGDRAELDAIIGELTTLTQEESASA
ncbi:hypothetical protein [Actibacterium ureilyticum]|uniref:hypothetical protein n=1 Tax=Actibacterium ureilyticum TaxID=1590614 RepID=UPI000BAAC213|nr:hypothetical protein [Actibacterium ureilyticum]